MDTQLKIGCLRRWSTDRQGDSYRKIAQVEVIEEKVRSLGYIPVLYDEGAVSGQKLENRAKARELLTDLRAGKISGLAALDLKRVTRDRIGIDRATIKQILIDSRAILITRDKVYDLRNANDSMIYDLLGAVSGAEVRQIRDTFWDGNVVRRISGLASTCGPAPLGYKHVVVGEVRANGTVARKMVKDPDHADIIRKFWEVASIAPSYSFIHKTLNGQGLYRPPSRRNPIAHPWALIDVQRTVRNWCYSGVLVLGHAGMSDVWDLHPTTRSNTHVRELTEHGGVYERDVPEWRYVDSELQREVLERLSLNPNPAAKNGGRRTLSADNPFGQVLRCLHCGGPMYSCRQYPKLKSGERTLRCTYRCREVRMHTGRCKGQMLSSALVLDAVFRHIQSMAESWEYTDQLSLGAATLRGRTPDDALSLAKGSLHTLEIKMKKLLDRELLTESEEEAAALKAIRKDTETEVRKTKQDIAGLESLVTSQETLERVRQLPQNFAQTALARDWYIQRQLIHSFLAEARLDGVGFGRARKLQVVMYRVAGSDEVKHVPLGHKPLEVCVRLPYVLLRLAVEILWPRHLNTSIPPASAVQLFKEGGDGR